MLGRLAVVAIAIALVATACGGHSKRNAIASYLTLVNSTESKLAQPLKAVSAANQAFAKKSSNPKVEVQLAQAEQTMQKLKRQLAGITPPPEAKHLHALLLELVDREVALTHEVYALSTFVPQFDADLQPLAAADASLKQELGRTAKGAAAAKKLDAEKAAALESYASIVDGVIARVQPLHPPPVWQPTYRGQLSSLEQLRDTGTALAQAIEANHAAALPALLRRFDAAALANQSLAAQRAQIDAVKTYNAQVNSLLSLARSIERERNRLQRVTT